MHPSTYNTGVLIDGRSLEVIDPQTWQNIPKLPTILAAYRKGKSGEQVDIFVNHFWYAVYTFGYAQLRKTEMGTKYLYRYPEFAFFESDIFDDRLRAVAYQAGISDLTDTSIKSLKSILRAEDRFWVTDEKNCGNGSVRIIHHDSATYYLLDKGRFICLNLLAGSHTAPIAFLYSSKSRKIDLADENRIVDRVYIGLLPEKQDKLHDTYNLLRLIGIPNEQQSLIVAWLVHIYLAKEPIVLQIVEDQNSLGNEIAYILKELIDPSAEECIPLPKKAKEIVECGFDEYLLHFSVPSNQKLSQEQQEALLNMTTKKGAKANAIKARKKVAECFVKRAVILSTQSNVINSPLLQSRTLTIELDVSPTSLPITKNYYFNTNQIRNELLECAIFISTYKLNSADVTKLSVTTSSPSFLEYLTIGQHIENLVDKGYGKFMKEFSKHMELDMFAQFNSDEDEELGFLLLQWAKENCGATKTQSIGHWQTTLERVAADNNSSIDEISPRKIGATFKKLKPVLKKLGIRLERVRDSSRFCEWTVAVQDTVGLINKAEEVPLSPV